MYSVTNLTPFNALKINNTGGTYAYLRTLAIYKRRDAGVYI